QTLELVEAARYDSAYTFIFSPRPGTEAASMIDDFVPSEICAERLERLVDAVERHALVRHVARVGRVEEALVEGPSRKDPNVLSGRTRQNKLVHFSGDVVAGDRVEVQITSAAPHWLRGELVEVTRRAPRERARIPLTVV